MRNGDPGQVDRMQLVYRVRIAYDEMRDTMGDGAHSRAAVAAARRKFSLLNRVLAMAALEGAA